MVLLDGLGYKGGFARQIKVMDPEGGTEFD